MKKLFSAFFLLFCIPIISFGKEVPEISIKKEIHQNGIPGECEVHVIITIAKGSLNTFAEYKEILQDVPKEMKVIMVKGASATFKFENNEVKFIWGQTTFKGTIEISYRLKNAGEMKLNIPGAFHYVYHNEKQEVDMKLEDIKFVND